MTEAQQLHKFVIGELRTDSWKSDWRKEFERRSAEEKHKPAPMVAAPQIKARQRKAVPLAKRCECCKKIMRAGTASDLCQPCRRRREHCDCGKVLKRTWPHPICALCLKTAEREVRTVHMRKCAEPGCDRILNRNNTLPKCLRHAAELRSAMNTERARQKRRLLRMAA